MLLWSSQATASLRGSVVDSSNAAIHWSRRGRDQHRYRSAARDEATNQDGIYVFPDLPIGSYSAQMSHDGFANPGAERHRTADRPHLEIQIPLTHRISASQSVEVTSDAPLIQTDLFERAGVRRSEADAGPSSERPQRAATHDPHPRHRVDQRSAPRAASRTTRA